MCKILHASSHVRVRSFSSFDHQMSSENGKLISSTRGFSAVYLQFHVLREKKMEPWQQLMFQYQPSNYLMARDGGNGVECSTNKIYSWPGIYSRPQSENATSVLYIRVISSMLITVNYTARKKKFGILRVTQERGIETRPSTFGQEMPPSDKI